jgi:hypothetical protein
MSQEKYIALHIVKGVHKLPNIFDNIRIECAEKSISLVSLTTQLGIERKTFYNWQSKGDLPLSALSKIAEILRVPVERLLQGAETEAKTDTA